VRIVRFIPWLKQSSKIVRGKLRIQILKKSTLLDVNSEFGGKMSQLPFNNNLPFFVVLRQKQSSIGLRHNA